MYKISVRFDSNIQGVYTYEEETATDEEHKDMKEERMLKRWLKIICPDVNVNIYFPELFLLLINNELDWENDVEGGNRKFTFTVEELN
jgi:hypothetical protein